MVEQSIYRKKRSIIWPLLAALLLIVISGLLFLPSLLSTDWAEKRIKQAVNSRIPGQINFDDLSLSWSKGILGQGITYDDRSGGIVVKVAQITTSKGLFALAANYKELGEIIVKDPVAYIYLDEKTGPVDSGAGASSDSGPEVPRNTSQDSSSSQSEKQAETDSPMTLPSLEARFIITGGSVKAVFSDMQEKLLLKDFELKAHFVGQESLLDYQAVFQAEDNSGQVKGTGTFMLSSGDGVHLDEIKSEAELDIEKWEIADLLQILTHFADLPSGSGQINGRMNITGNTSTSLQLKGKLTGQQIKLQGGPLKSDTPSLDMVALEIDAEQKAGVIILNQFSLTSGLATATARGRFESPDKKEISSQAEIDLAQLFAQFPDSLNLKEGTTVSSGKVGLKANVRGSGKTINFDGSARLDQLQGIAGGKKIAWDKPVVFEARGEQNSAGFRLDNFVVQSAFLNGIGKGDFNHMKIELMADIGAALKEVEKFIQLEGWKSNGKMNLNLQLETQSEIVRSVTADVGITDFVLRRKDRIIAPRNSFKACLVTDLYLDQDMHPQEIKNFSLDFQSWIGGGVMSLKKLVVPSQQVGSRFEDLDFKGDIYLQHLTTLLQTLDVLPQNTRFAGRVNVSSRLSFEDNILALGKTSIDAVDFVLQKDKQKFNEKKIQLITGGSVNLEKKSVSLKPFDLKIAEGNITFPELHINDWDHLPDGLRTKGSVGLDLGLLTLLLGDALDLGSGTTLSGLTTFKIDTDMTDAKQQSILLEGNIGPIEISVKDKQLISEESIQLLMDFKGDVLERNFAFPKLAISSRPVSLNVAGTVTVDKLERVLNAEGFINVDLKAASDYLKKLVDLELSMTGETEEPFTIKMTSVDGKWSDFPKQSEISTTFHADTIRGFGLFVESLEVPVQLANALAEIDIQATVNSGKMALKSAVDFTADTPVISIFENSQVLTGVGLGEEMSNDLLAKVHPLFKGAAISEGTMDLGLHHFSWPLDTAKRKSAAFAGSITFNGVKLKAGGLLNALLEVVKGNEREITLSDKPMEFVGENGRIRCSPLEIKTKEHTILLSGSVGFDQSLDYKAQIPVTRGMVGGDMYKYLEGTVISVPIGGTVSKPSLKKDILQSALKDLVIQAGTKQLTDKAGNFLQNLFK